MHRKLRIWLAIVALIVVATGAAFYLTRQAAKAPAANTVAVYRGSIEATIDVLGTIEPQNAINLSTRSSGTVQTISVEEGDTAEAGKLLLSLDTRLIEDAVTQAERVVALRQQTLDNALDAPSSAQIRLATARLRRATAARQKAQQDYDDMADEPNAESSDEALSLAVAKLEYETAQAEFDQVMEGATDLEMSRLEVDLDSAQQSLAQAQARLEDAVVRAPMAGTVLKINAMQGANVTGYSALIQMADLETLHVVAEIDELDIAQVTPGQSATIRLDAFPGETLAGVVTRVKPGVSDTRGATTYEAIVEYTNDNLPLRPGMNASLTIVTQRVDGALLVPRAAIRQVGRHQVATVVDGRHSRDAIVTTGLSDGIETVIVSGLEEGQLVRVD